MFCPRCGNILDCRSTVVCSSADGKQAVVCGKCWDAAFLQLPNAEIVDGRKLWTSTPAAKRVSKPKSKHTFCERLERGLVASGWSRDWSASTSKYAAWARQGEDYKLFTGPSGALRRGHCSSRSISIGQPGNERGRYTDLLKAGDDALYLDAHAKV